MRVLFLAKTKGDFLGFASQVNILTNLLLEKGNEVDVYDYSIGVKYELKTRKKINYNTKFNFRILKHLNNYFSFRRFFKQNASKYGFLQIMYVRPEYFFLAKKIRLLAKVEFINVYGSDVNTFQWYKKCLQKIFKEADFISFTTTDSLNSFVHNYKFSDTEKLIVKMIPLSRLRVLDKNKEKSHSSFRNKYNIDFDYTIVVCGMNGSSNEQIKVLVKSIGEKIFDKVVFVFPLTYGSNQKQLNNTIKYIQGAIRNNRVIIISNYLSEEEILELRFATDILINLRKKDQVGAAFLESLSMQSYVITGSWLPYKFLNELGVFFKMINSPSDLVYALEEGIMLYKNTVIKEKLKNNMDIINHKYSLENTIFQWDKFYEETFALMFNKYKE